MIMTKEIRNLVDCVECTKEAGTAVVSTIYVDNYKNVSSFVIEDVEVDDDDKYVTIYYDHGLIILEAWDNVKMDEYGVIFTFRFPSGLIQIFDFTQAA
jgi:hypothetical protein